MIKKKKKNAEKLVQVKLNRRMREKKEKQVKGDDLLCYSDKSMEKESILEEEE